MIGGGVCGLWGGSADHGVGMLMGEGEREGKRRER